MSKNSDNKPSNIPIPGTSVGNSSRQEENERVRYAADGGIAGSPGDFNAGLGGSFLENYLKNQGKFSASKGSSGIGGQK